LIKKYSKEIVYGLICEDIDLSFEEFIKIIYNSRIINCKTPLILQRIGDNVFVVDKNNTIKVESFLQDKKNFLFITTINKELCNTGWLRIKI
jgi:hypothetical protein